MAETPARTCELLWPEGAPGALGKTPEDMPRVTHYILPSREKTACIVVCPGGGYGMRAPHEAEPIALWLNSLGVSAVVLDYRVAPYHHPVPLGDAKRAMRLVRHRACAWGIDGARIGILGFSAGGHLAASAGTLFDAGDPDATDAVDRESSRPDALVLCYAVITFGEFRHDGCMHNLFGEGVSEDLRRDLSLETRVRADTPPAFIWHTGDDNAVPVEHAILFASAMRRHGVPFALHIFPHGTHGLGLAEGDATVRSWTALCGEWLRSVRFR
jgi:acetyl esterase/lipase